MIEQIKGNTKGSRGTFACSTKKTKIKAIKCFDYFGYNHTVKITIVNTPKYVE